MRRDATPASRRRICWRGKKGSATSGRLPSLTALPICRSDSKAQAEQVRAVSTDRLRGRIGELPAEMLKQVDEALRLHLAL
ncbi:type II toxin-antitoxin system PemK/MazF family toxin [Kutzneria sp. 744]|uniref:type II toxin-antitoxin system PemK/MazF family toxin n=1 Tax=Kutzneria sp. (strain 744) TaxID=345341 RepID=UPI0003EED17E|nr:type II toxin-antitoxin system PemK/MazF family toxin [Kutzneria sp. 744]EWM15459.1 hypothetical protein KUTG_05763 [Kutzneria sp. 744]